MRHKWAGFGSAILLLLSNGGAIASENKEPAAEQKAAMADHGTLSFVVENDAFVDTDQNYTNGLRVAYFSAPVSKGPAVWIGQHILRAGPNSSIHYGIETGQNIYTPVDTNTPLPLPDQHPYAGYLYGGFAVVVDRGHAVDTLAVQAGVVGPMSLGEDTQRTFHRWIDVAEPQGWANQLRNEPAGYISYERKWRKGGEWHLIGLGADLMPSLGMSAGNLRTDARAGLTFRVGNDLHEDFGPPRVRPSLAGEGFFMPRDNFSWYLFADAVGYAVAHDIFLDGNTWKQSASVDRNVFVFDIQAGAAVQIGRAQFAYTYVVRSPEFETQDGSQQFGAVSVSFKL